MKPHIGINADYEDGAKPYHKLYTDYTGAVVSAGGIPVILPDLHEDEDILSVLSSLDGLLLTGGRDVDPLLYGAHPHDATRVLSEERLLSDQRLVELALVMEMPLLGICLGCQQLNVALGGTLIQDVPSETGSSVPHAVAGKPGEGVMHTVRVIEGTRLHSILRTVELEVSSSHHQAIGELGKGLVVSAVSPGDDVIEALEVPDKWVVAVQWHPERQTAQKEHLALFEALVAASSP